MKVALTISMLVVSNVFMTWAWYGHLKKGSAADDKPLLLIILMSWGVAFFEYCFMIPWAMREALTWPSSRSCRR